MTTEIPDAKPIGDGVFKVPPQAEHRIPGTGFVVWHDEVHDATVRILSDGALDLCGANYWIVRTT